MVTRTKEDLEEVGRLGKETYFRLVRPYLTKDDEYKHVVLDIDTGEYEIDKDDYAAARRMRDRNPTGRLFGIIAGYTIGGSFCGMSDKYRDPL